MSMLRNTLLLTLITLGAPLAKAGDFDQLLDTIKKSLPGKTQGLVACNLESAKGAVRELAEAAHHRGFKIRFMDIRTSEQAGFILSSVRTSAPDWAILIGSDAQLGTQGSKTKSYISGLQSIGVPVFGLEEGDLKMGAALAVSPKTQGKVIPNPGKVQSFGIKL